MLFLLVALALLADEPSARAPSPPPAAAAPYWLRAPTVEEMVQAYPSEPRAAGVGGRAEIDCAIAADGALTACAVARELPERQGFGAAALSLASRMQLGAEYRSAPRFAGGRVRVPFIWREAACPPLFPLTDEVVSPPGATPQRTWNSRFPVIQTPAWIRRPTFEDMRRFYPDRAARLKLAGKTTISCEVTFQGALAACRIMSETPEGEDFGAASLKVARLFKMKPMTADCDSVAGAKVRIPLVWSPSP